MAKNGNLEWSFWSKLFENIFPIIENVSDLPKCKERIFQLAVNVIQYKTTANNGNLKIPLEHSPGKKIIDRFDFKRADLSALYILRCDPNLDLRLQLENQHRIKVILTHKLL